MPRSRKRKECRLLRIPSTSVREIRVAAISLSRNRTGCSAARISAVSTFATRRCSSCDMNSVRIPVPNSSRWTSMHASTRCITCTVVDSSSRSAWVAFRDASHPRHA
eukprot:scaffold64789_cov45-Phaeocystis_antarctica.AAC.2